MPRALMQVDLEAAREVRRIRNTLQTKKRRERGERRKPRRTAKHSTELKLHTSPHEEAEEGSAEVEEEEAEGAEVEGAEEEAEVPPPWILVIPPKVKMKMTKNTLLAVHSLSLTFQSEEAITEEAQDARSIQGLSFRAEILQEVEVEGAVQAVQAVVEAEVEAVVVGTSRT